MKTHTVETAAEMLAVDPTTIRALIDDGKLPAAKIGRSYVMLENDLEEYLRQRIREQTAERIERGVSADRRRNATEASKTTRYRRRALPDLAQYEVAA